MQAASFGLAASSAPWLLNSYEHYLYNNDNWLDRDIMHSLTIRVIAPCTSTFACEMGPEKSQLEII